MIYNEILKIHTDTFGGQSRLFAAPGRINLIGEHTDYNQGFVLPAAIDKKTYLVIAPAADHHIELVAADLGESFAFWLDDQPESLPHWALYPYGVIRELQQLGYTQIGGFKAVFGGDIPGGAGLSSSAALESVFALALNTLFDLGADRWSLAKAGQAAEHKHVGVRCGIMDQFASLFGKVDHVMQLDCQSLQYTYYPLQLQDHVLVLADTGVKHSLAASAYNDRRNDCEEGVRLLSQNHQGLQSLRQVSREMLQNHAGVLDATVMMRCQYVVEENLRVLDSCQALLEGQLSRLGQQLKASHQGLRDQYQVSCPELDLLAETAWQVPGVLGARMMGGGFGGCTLNLLHQAALNCFYDQLTEKYQQEFGQTPHFYEVKTSQGAEEIFGY